MPGRLRRFLRSLRRARRRSTRLGERIYIEARPLEPQQQPGFAEMIAARLGGLPGVTWARYNAPLDRVVVSAPASLDDEVISALEDVEADLGVDLRPFRADPQALPGDAELLRRLAVEIGADVGALALTTALNLAGRRPGPGGIDVAALLRIIEEVPWMRQRFEDWLGVPSADLALGLADAFDAVALQGRSGPVVDIAWRTLRAASTHSVARSWRAWEAQVGDDPAAHEAVVDRPSPRPGELPPGPVEVYTERATLAALGGFGIGVAATRRFESASAAVLGGVPKAARQGRRVYAAVVADRLVDLGWQVRDPVALRSLDRLDTVLLPGALLAQTRGEIVHVRALVGDEEDASARVLQMFLPDQPFSVHVDGAWSLGPLSTLSLALAAPIAEPLRAAASPGGRLLGLVQEGTLRAVAAVRPEPDASTDALLRAIRQRGLLLAVATDHPERVSWLALDRVLPEGDALPAALRVLQAEGHGVLVIWPGDHPVLTVADLAVALPGPGPVPWSAHLVAPGEPGAVTAILHALERGRMAAVHSVRLSALDALASLAMTLERPGEPATRRVLGLSHLASAAAMADAWWLASGVGPLAMPGARDHTPWHALDASVVLERLASSPAPPAPSSTSRGAEPDVQPGWLRVAEMVAAELDNPLAGVLATGAALSALTGSGVDAMMVGGVLAINGVIGAAQRVRAEHALAELDHAETRFVRVVRQGHTLSAPPASVQRGDLIRLEAGEIVPADARIVRAVGLEVDESALTGESLPVAKDSVPSFATALADRTSMLYAGTTIASGEVEAIVVATGDQTEARATPDSPVKRTVSRGVEVRLEALTGLTGPLAAAAGAALLVSGLLRRRPPGEVIGASISLSVAAVPEGLPLLAMLAQLAAARRLAARGALTRNPRAVEALGRVDVLCADKTGTLTEGRLRLRFVSDGGEAVPIEALDPAGQAILAAAVDATPAPPEIGPLPHPTDQAVVDAARKVGLPSPDTTWERRFEIPFEPKRGWHAVAGRRGTRHRLVVKGAPEKLLPLCRSWRQAGKTLSLDGAGRAAVEARVASLTGAGLRVLLVADRPLRLPLGSLDADAVRDLTGLGLVALADPVRAEAREAVRRLEAAGVKVVMITGDHPGTARAIGLELGLSSTRVLTGPELDALDHAALTEALRDVGIFARTTPQGKTRIVTALQAAGHVVAMTGDGANDAPAIRQADVGIALGDRATTAARHAADLVVADGRIETLVEALLEGRALWTSVKDAVAILVGGNLGEIVFSLLGGLLDGRPPLNARQLLLVNLLTDALPALTLAVRAPSGEHPEELAQAGPEGSLGAALDRAIGWRATVTAGTTGAAWLAARATGDRKGADTIALLTLCGVQLGQSLVAAGTDRNTALAASGSMAALLGIVQTPGLSGFFGSRPLGPVGLGIAATATAVGTAASAFLPPMVEGVADRFLDRWRAGGWDRSEAARLVTESRTLNRIRDRGRKLRARSRGEGTG